MREQVDHHLRRARAAARQQGGGERTAVAPVLEELALTLERIFRDKGVEIDWRAPDELCFHGERQDLLEMAGNVMENACKWCKARVRVDGRADDADDLQPDGRGRRPGPGGRRPRRRCCSAARGWTRPRPARASASPSSTSWPGPTAATLTLADSALRRPEGHPGPAARGGLSEGSVGGSLTPVQHAGIGCACVRSRDPMNQMSEAKFGPGQGPDRTGARRGGPAICCWRSGPTAATTRA